MAQGQADRAVIFFVDSTKFDVLITKDQERYGLSYALLLFLFCKNKALLLVLDIADMFSPEMTFLRLTSR